MPNDRLGPALNRVDEAKAVTTAVAQPTVVDRFGVDPDHSDELVR